MPERLFVKSRTYIPLNLEQNVIIHIGDIVEVGYKIHKRIILLNIPINNFITANFLTLDNKIIYHSLYISPLFDFKDKIGSSIFYFGEDTDTIKKNKIYTIFYETPTQTCIMVKEFKNEIYDKTKFRLLTIEEERVLKLKKIGFDFVG